MSDIVIVAVIGVLGTLVGSVLAPIVKERVDRRSRVRDVIRADIQDRVLAISQTLRQMVRLDGSNGQEWNRLHAQLEGDIGRLDLLLSRGEGDVSSVVEITGVFARQGVTAVERALNPLVVSTAIAMLARWYRGERKAKGMAQEAVDFMSLSRRGFVNGTLRPGGEPIPESDLTEEERRERLEFQNGAGN